MQTKTKEDQQNTTTAATKAKLLKAIDKMTDQLLGIPSSGYNEIGKAQSIIESLSRSHQNLQGK